MLINVIYGVFLAIWRRIFGGLAEDKNIPILKIRAVQHVIGFIGCCVALWLCNYSLFQIITCAGVLQGLFWARGHGEFFDYGHNLKPDVSRYEEFWWWEYFKKHIPQNQLYNYTCDFVCMCIRYTLPSIIISLILINIPFILSGVIVAGVYALMWAFYCLGILKTYPTQVAEIISGFLVGVILTL